MLPKKKRLTTKAFNQFFKDGRRFHSDSLQYIFTPHPVFHGSAVVGKKVHRSAVKRNKLRRKLYDILYRADKAQQLSGVYILIAKPKSKERTYQELKDEILTTLGKIEQKQKAR